MPFFRPDSDEPAVVVLEQTSPTSFRIREQFCYVDRRSGKSFVVPEPPGNDTTDLASVPGILMWFVPRYGHHTLPALLHDQLVDDGRTDREEADRIFRDAMGEQGVRLVRRWLMWAAVSIATIAKASRWWLVPVGAWLLVWGLIAFRLTPPFAAWDVWPFSLLVDVPWGSAAVAAAAGPPVAGVLWGRRYLTGVISGYGAFLFAVPIVAVLLALAVYWAFEGPLLLVARRRPPAPLDRSMVEVMSRPEA